MNNFKLIDQTIKSPAPGRGGVGFVVVVVGGGDCLHMGIIFTLKLSLPQTSQVQKENKGNKKPM